MRLWSNSEVPKGAGGFNPERRLLAAVLQRAITDYLTGDGEIQSSAQEWLFNEDDNTSDTFGFAYICEALDFHASELRKAVSRQQQRQLAESAANTAMRIQMVESVDITSVAA